MERVRISQSFIKSQSYMCPEYAKLIKQTIKQSGSNPIIEGENNNDYFVVPFIPYFLGAISIPKIHCEAYND